MDKTSCIFMVMCMHCFLLATCLALSPTDFTTTDDQYVSLLAFKAHITYDPFHILKDNWTTTTSVCNWVGVSCGSRRHRDRVTALNLTNMGLRGTVAPHLGNLSFLIHLNLSNNYFHGHLPSELSQLRRLKIVNFKVNNFSGEVPSWFGMLPKLQYLILGNNTFSGSFPLSLCNISGLEGLDLRFNLLTGDIPERIGNLQKLKILVIRYNQLSGSMPSTIFNVSSLQAIDFTSSKLSGSLPDDMCLRLSKLEGLYLSLNQLYGQIPSTIGECKRLQALSLSYNKFTGIIPKGIWNLTMLQGLVLGPNNLQGALPGDMCSKLQQLQILGLTRNKLTGRVPRELGNCSSLTDLSLAENNFSGIISQEIGILQNMELLAMDLNNLRGPVPATIFNMSRIEVISLGGNQLSGDLPMDTGLRLPNLRELYLEMNMLRGMIPDTISNASKFTDLDLGFNRFSGSIPNSLGNLKLLQGLYLSGNNFMDESSLSLQLNFITSLTNCRHLKALRISGNPLNGILPNSIGNLSASMEYMEAGECGIRGNIPSEIGNLTNLVYLNLFGNNLTGFIPITFKKLMKLQQLILGNNNLQGSVPVDLCHLKNLGALYLQENKFSGSIPACLGNNMTTFLRYLKLNSNHLTSTIPTSLWSLADLLVIDFSSNSLIGYISPEVGKLKATYLLKLSMNQLSGEIPSTIGGLQNLIGLYLEYNRLNGDISPLVGSMTNLQFLDLSHNELSGVIPLSLEGLLQLEYFNVSFNMLMGEIPNKGPFANFTYQSFMSNKALCGTPQFHVPLCHNHKLRRMKKILLILLPIGFVFLAMAFIISFIRRQRKRKIPTEIDLLTPVSYRRVAYREILQATEMFSENNLLGIGSFSSVYKGRFSDGMIMAVKVFNLQLDGAFKSFDMECEILRNIRHRNLTKVISNCSTPEFKALLLEYMPNGSLEKWLYSPNYFLDILQRLDIMMDVACALEYLHHGCSIPVVHCDMKPSNVLLDEDMVGHVSDFGIAKLLGDEESITQTRTLATLGYIAPEYGFEGLVSTRCDVYSYGIMLMETFTRRRPNDAMFNTGDLSMKQWVENSLPNNEILEIMDANLLGPDEQVHYSTKLQCATSIMKLALKCSADLPQERMNIKDVLAALKKIRHQFLTN